MVVENTILIIKVLVKMVAIQIPNIIIMMALIRIISRDKSIFTKIIRYIKGANK